MVTAIIQTVIVYGLLTIIMFYLSKQAYNKGNNIYLTYALIIYAIIFSLRYCVGVDYMGYVYMYEEVRFGLDVEKEYAFIFLIKILSSLGLNVESLFFFCAFFQLFFIFKIFQKHKEIYPYLVLTFMIGGEWLIYSNIIRNMFAFAIVVFSLKYVQNKSPIKHYLWLILAFLFHKSSAIMIFVYPLYLIKPSFFNKRLVPYCLIAASLVIMNINYIQDFVAYMDKLMSLLGYAEKYGNDERMDMEVSLGMGFVIELAITCTIIFCAPATKKYYTKLPINIMFDLFVIGQVFKYSFIGSMLIQRMNTYFIGYTFILAAMELSYMKREKIYTGRNVLLGLYAVLGFAILYRMLDNSAMFIFNFQKDLFYLKREFE